MQAERVKMRVNNSIKNILVALVGQGLGVVLSFISRMIFIGTLGAEYLGVNGLFTNVLSILSLAELGIGSAIIYSLYKPLAVKDDKQVKALMRFYSKAYTTIGVIVLSLGIILIPFLEYLIKDKPDIENIILIYLLFLLNTVVSYFCAYKRSLIIADQKSYITTIYRYGFYIVLQIVQGIGLILTRNFIIFLVSQIIITILENLRISVKANKMYPFLLNNKEELDRKSKDEINKNVKALICHKVGSVVVSGTDNILISSLIGIVWVGLYSNYYLIINAINIILGQMFSAVTASVGNLNALETKGKSYKVYTRMLLVNFWLGGFCSIALWILFNPFIVLWIGSEYLFESKLVLIIIINFYITIVRRTTIVYKDSLGLFWEDRYKPVCEAIINIVVSVLLAPKLGIAGIFIGTFVSTMTTAFWVEPYILYKYGFGMKVRDYFIRYIKYTSIILVTGIITHQMCTVFTTVTWISLFGRAAVCLIVPNLIFLGCFYRTDEFKYFWNLFKGIMRKVFRLKSKKLA